MFRKLRNKLIIINLSITTLVVLVTFTAIYLFATGAASGRSPVDGSEASFFSDEVSRLIQISIEQEKRAAARDLLVTLIISGICIEIVVAIMSYYLAEEAVRPVREAYESQKLFIANASHEIKTPLAAISANLEAADIHGNKWIANVEKETEKLTALNNELLTLARTDLVEKSVLDEVNLKKVTIDYLKGFEPRLGQKRFKSTFATHGRVRLAKQDYEQVLGILIDNAIKYSNQEIVLTLSNEKLTVANDGAKLSEQDLAHVFERFYQADKSAEGVGLGLSIAKSVAMRNGWKLTVTSSDKMTCFTLQF